MKERLFIFIIFFFIFLDSFSQTPHLEGRIFLDLDKGYLFGDVKLSNLPDLKKNYRILLNRGLNFKHVKVDSLPLFYQYWNVKTDLYSAEYALLRSENDTVSSPEEIKISYVGAFPVYENEYNSFDDMGIIAHNGNTFRATPQAAWYPLIKDLTNNRLYSSYTYDLMVECPQCQEIYLNGSVPVKETVKRFKSDKPRDLLLFAGDFEFDGYDEAIFINSTLGRDETQLFSMLIGEITTFYEDKTGVKFTDKPVFLRHDPIEKFNSGRTWGFVVYPTFATAGKADISKLNLEEKDFHYFSSYAFYAHELAHFYFGTLFRSSGSLQHFFGESFPEYLALKSVEEKYGTDSTKILIKDKISSLKNSKESKDFIPLSKVTDPEQINSSYRYSLGPLLLLYLEKEFGEKKVFDLIRLILKDKNVAETDYPYFTSKLKIANIEENELRKIETKIFNNPDYLFELESKLLTEQGMSKDK